VVRSPPDCHLSGTVMKWSNIQLPLFSTPCTWATPPSTSMDRTYKVKGFELQLVARVTEGLSLEARAR